MEPNGAELYEQLLGYLAAEGAFEEDAGNGLVVLMEFDHRILEQPLRLHLTPGTFEEHLRRAAPDSVTVYPDVHPMEAAWKLFTVHLDEAVQTARPGETELVLRRFGVEPTRPDGTRTPFAQEVEEHIARQQHFERLLRHLADRGDHDLELHHEVFVIKDLDGRAFPRPLRVRVPSDEFGRYVGGADDPADAYDRLVDQLDDLLSTVDPTRSAIEFADGRFSVRARQQLG